MILPQLGQNERLDAFLNRAVLELRNELAGAEAADGKGACNVRPPADDLADGDLIDTSSASARFNYPRDTIAKWCREEKLGVRRGGRWLIDPKKLRARLNGRE